MQDHFFALWANLNAGISGKFLQLIGYQTTVMSDIITSPQFTVSIKKGCDAMEPLALFFSGIIAFPTLWEKKLSGLGVGLLIIFTLNIIRIVTLFLTGIYYPSLFETMHVEVWQVIFILTAIAIWFLWLRWAVKQTKK